MSDVEGLVPLTRPDAGRAIDVLCRAFQPYPLLKYYFPVDSERTRISSYFMSFAVFCGIKYGRMYATSENMEGIAVWHSSDTYPISIWRWLRAVPFSTLFNFGRYGGGRLKKVGEHIDSVHKRLAPFRHTYLEIIGVDPRFQGQGYAGKLIKPVLDNLDKEGLPCYLETLDRKNVLIYEHFGFRVIDESAIPGTPLVNWAMLRGRAE